jgi:hypothetical protein
MQSFINEISYKCLLGPQAKNVQVINNLVSWQVGKSKVKQHFTNLNAFSQLDIDYLKTFPSNFHYLTPENMELLKLNFKVDKVKLNSCCLDLTKLNYTGRKYHNIRGAINSCVKANLTIQDNYNDINDVKKMLDRWSEEIGAKYFRSFSGKNLYFYKNNFHLTCNNIFVYDQENLVGFATLTKGEYSTYVIGKALFTKHKGLSEYVDDLAYRKALTDGTTVVNLGQSKGKLADYKDKWPGSFNILHYDGSIE